MPYLDVNDLRFHYQVLSRPSAPDASPRPKVVMVHGLMLDDLGSYYYTLANPVALAADTYLYDLRGHGRTETPRRGYTVADHVADLRGLLDAWQIDEPVHLVSNSFGGVVALTLATQHPDLVASLALIEAHFGVAGWGEYFAGGLALAAFGLDEQRVKEWLEQEGTRKLNRLARHSQDLFLNSTIIDDMQRERPFPLDALQGIEHPTLAVYGDGSDILDRAHILQEQLPRCELHVVPGCTHSVLTEATPVVRQLTVDWVREHAGVREGAVSPHARQEV